MEIHPKIQEVAVLSGTAMRFVLDRLTVAEGWSELPPVPARPSAHIEHWTSITPGLPNLSAEHPDGLPQLNKAHRAA